MESLIPFIETAGYIGVFGMVFAESGLLFGFIFPGDTLLFAAGLLASKGFLNIYVVLVLSTIAAITGDSVGYWIGKKLGPKLFVREESFFFKQKYVTRAQRFFEKHGRKTIFLSRYIPIVRTFAPVVAGIGTMKYKTFLAYNIAGGITWCFSIILLGYFLGTEIENIYAYILPVSIGILGISLCLVVWQLIRSRRADSTQ